MTKGDEKIIVGKDITYKGYKFEKENDLWIVRLDVFCILSHKTIPGLKKLLNKFLDEKHTTMLSYFAHGGAKLNVIRSDIRK